MSRRDRLVEMGLEEAIVFEDPDYDSAIIGYDANSERVVYDYDKMVEHLMDEGWDCDDAVEFIEYNTIRACPYMGERAPIVMRAIPQEMIEF